jgi:NADH-quinone oxidoreductase subunit L
MAAAVMTAFYSWRLLFMTFHGEPRASQEVMSHVHESPWSMLVPLYFLAAGSILSGVLFNHYFVGDGHEAFWGQAIFLGPDNNIMKAFHHVPAWVKWAPIVAGVVGIAVAWKFYIRRPDIPASLAKLHHELYLFLLNKWYFDELFDLTLVNPAKWLGRLLWKGGDGRIIDGFGPDGLSAMVLRVARRASALQSGYLYHYAFAMLIGVAVLVTLFYTSSGGGH